MSEDRQQFAVSYLLESSIVVCFKTKILNVLVLEPTLRAYWSNSNIDRIAEMKQFFLSATKDCSQADRYLMTGSTDLYDD